MQSKADFFMGLFGFFMSQITGIMFLFLVFEQIPYLQGWSLEQLIFIYGFAQIPRGIDHLFTDNLWMLSWNIVVSGNFDRYMLRPVNLLFQVISEKLQPNAVGELIIGVILVIRAAYKGIIKVDFIHLVLFVASVIAGALIYTAIKLFFSSLAFWVKMSGPFLMAVYSLADFAKYPTEIYVKGIRFIITYVIPFAFVAYLPANYFIAEPRYGAGIILAEWFIAGVFCVIAGLAFKCGTYIYESTGN